MAGPAATTATRAGIVDVETTSLFISDGTRLRRRPRLALLPRPLAFRRQFESRAIFYDCFWHADGERVLLVGPPPGSLAIHYTQARYFAQPLDYWLAAHYHTSLSVTVTELRDVPRGTKDIHATICGEAGRLPIGENLSERFAGRRLLFSMNRDNELSWIREWAHWHAHHHGADAVVLFDNGSTKYTPAEIAAVLAEVPGIAVVAVPSWPFRFGPRDPSVLLNPYWARFLQISSMSVALRRFGAHAHSLLDCDIDELAVTTTGTSIFDLAKRSDQGLVAFRGTWVEAVAEPGSQPAPPHSAYRQVLEKPSAASSRQRKWALDPSRDWVEQLNVHPYWHWIEGRPFGARTMPSQASYRHFRGISTGWKEDRSAAPAGPVVRDPLLDAGFKSLR